MLHTQFSRVCRCPNAKTCSSVFGRIKVDARFEKSVEDVYAIGDVIDGTMLAHKAEHEGVICIENIAGLDTHSMKKEHIPGCTYCHPQVASVGLTEANAKKAGHEVKIGRFSFIGNGKAIALGEPDGMIKTIFNKFSSCFITFNV